MRLKMGMFEYKKRIEFCDIDENNRLSSKGLIRILGEIAGLHSESVGYGLNHVPQTHLTWMLLNWKIQFFVRPSWNSYLIIKTWARSFSKISSNRDFSIYDINNNLVAKATSKWVLVNSEKHTPVRITEEIHDTFGEYNSSVFDTEVNDKEKEPESSKFIYDYQIKRRDLDTNHHVNNLYYLDFAFDALPKELWEVCFDNIEIIYRKQIKLDDTIKCFYSYYNNQHIVTIKSEDLSVVHAIVKLY